MPYYHKLGNIPPKRHTQFEKPSGGFYYEQLFGTVGFDGMATLSYHEQRPTQIKSITSDIQDMVSAYYYLRDHYDTDTIKVGHTVKLNMFFDNEIFGFKLKFLGRETTVSYTHLTLPTIDPV